MKVCHMLVEVKVCLHFYIGWSMVLDASSGAIVSSIGDGNNIVITAHKTKQNRTKQV